MVVYGNFLCVFGGPDEDNQKLNDLWTWDSTNRKWTEIKGTKGTFPHPRCGHSASIDNDMMLIFGGLFEVTHETNDICGFDFK